MTYQIVYSRRARKQLMEFSPAVSARLYARISNLSSNPRPRGCVKLSGIENAYRIRVGDYRMLYEIRDKQLVIVVVKVAKRDEQSYKHI